MVSSSRRTILRSRLSSYWRLEMGNAVLLPAAMFLLVYSSGSRIGWLSWFAFVPMCALLLVGGLYWRGKLHALDGRPAALSSALGLAHRGQMPVLAVSAAALLAALASWFVPELSVSLADRMVASAASALAVLEYVNYYHRQLQHFDHRADFERLLSGRGFRKSQMAVDLARFRAGRR